MNRMYLRINEMWRRFFDLPMNEEFIDLKLNELQEAESKAPERPDGRELDARIVQQYCCTIFWDIDDPRRQPDKSRTVTSQKMCDDWRASCGAKGCRPLLKGPC
jgi:hypothetical protein